MTSREVRNYIAELQKAELEDRKRELDEIIQKLYNHPIALNDKHYKFLQEIENDLRDFRINFL